MATSDHHNESTPPQGEADANADKPRKLTPTQAVVAQAVAALDMAETAERSCSDDLEITRSAWGLVLDACSALKSVGTAAVARHFPSGSAREMAKCRRGILRGINPADWDALMAEPDHPDDEPPDFEDFDDLRATLDRLDALLRAAHLRLAARCIELEAEHAAALAENTPEGNERAGRIAVEQAATVAALAEVQHAHRRVRRLRRILRERRPTTRPHRPPRVAHHRRRLAAAHHADDPAPGAPRMGSTGGRLIAA